MKDKGGQQGHCDGQEGKQAGVGYHHYDGNQLSNEFACSSITCRRPWSINKLWHLGKDVTHEIVKGLNMNVQQRQMVTCWACTVAQAKQKNIV